MFLRRTARKKNGKTHHYWNVVENKRLDGGRVVQRHVLYLGEINSSQAAAWRKAIEVFDEDAGRARTLALFPEDRCETVAGDASVVQLRLSEMQLRRPRQWGACWLAGQLWQELQLDRFWSDRLPPSRKRTRWDQVLQVLATYRLIAPGSEWRLHRQWFGSSAMADLLGADFGLAEEHKLYACHDLLLQHKEALFSHLVGRWRDLFNADFDVLHAPQCDQKLSGKCNDHRRLTLSRRTFGPGSIPLPQCAFLLEAQEAPRQLNEAAPHACIARLRQTLLTSFDPALVGRPSEAGVTSYGPSISKVSRQDLLHQHIRCLDTNTDDACQHPHHCMRASARRLFQAFKPSLLDCIDLLADPSQSRHIAPQFIKHVWWDWHALRCILCFKALWRLEQFRLEAADAKTNQRRFHAIDNPSAFTDQAFALAAWAPGVFFLKRWDRDHFAVTRLTTQPS